MQQDKKHATTIVLNCIPQPQLLLQHKLFLGLCNEITTTISTASVAFSRNIKVRSVTTTAI